MTRHRRDSSLLSIDEDSAPYFLPSTFSPWRSVEQVDEDYVGSAGAGAGAGTANDGGAAGSESDTSQQQTTANASDSPPRAPETPKRIADSGPGQTRRPSLRRFSSTVYTASSPKTVSPLTPKPSGQRSFTTPEVVVSAPSDTDSINMDGSRVQRGIGRQSRFQELMSRSLTSHPWERRDASPPREGEYENNKARNETSEFPLQPTPNSFPMSSVDTLRPPTEYRSSEEELNADDFCARYAQPPVDCHSRRDVHIKRWSWIFVTLVALSLYSTLLSGLWLVVSIYQPRYGRGISSSEGWRVAPSTATLLCTLFAKTIELSFVTVFVAVLGQVLTRRAFVKKSKGMTIAEMTMRNWVIQPGSLLTYWGGIPYAAATILGALTLSATLCSMFYTTASDAMVSPKLKFGAWESRELSGLVKASYANPFFVRDACATPIDSSLDEFNAAPSCLDVQYSGQSYHNLLAFMKEWEAVHSIGTGNMTTIDTRPTGKHNLFDNTTMVSSWIEGENSSPSTSPDRVINNVTLAMPHPGVYAAATDPRNGILQPHDLSGVGEYSVRASVVSPAVNVMCVNMDAVELAPLVYTTWPDARNQTTDIPGQEIGADDWYDDVPIAAEGEWLNSTVVDDVFRWGEKYGRRPPVFQLYPIDYNMLTNTTVIESDAIYILAKSGVVSAYTLCELRSWVTSKCATEFNISGTSGGHMQAHCEDPSDADSYSHVFSSLSSSPPDSDAGPISTPSVDWRNLADQWRLSMNLNGGTQNNNASNARILTNLILGAPRLDPLLPSISEALAVLASSTLVAGSLYSTYASSWVYPSMQLDPGTWEPFRASVQTQQYTSSHVAGWQAVFYVVLALVFVLNCLCLAYLFFHGCCLNAGGLVTDYTEPQNLFALSINSPPSRALAGSCGHGPDSLEMVVPWRVGYSAGANHYFFEETNQGGVVTAESGNAGGRNSKQTFASGSDVMVGPGGYRSSYKRLSSSRTWL